MLGYMWAILLGIKFLQNRRQRLLVAVFLAPLLGGMLAAPYLLPLFMTRDYVYYREVNDLLKPGKEGAFLSIRRAKIMIIPSFRCCRALSDHSVTPQKAGLQKRGRHSVI